jgi:hypothetical protein
LVVIDVLVDHHRPDGDQIFFFSYVRRLLKVVPLACGDEQKFLKDKSL